MAVADQLEALAMVGRLTASISLPLLSSLLRDCFAAARGLVADAEARANTSAEAPAQGWLLRLSPPTALSTVYSQLHWLVLLAGALLSDDAAAGGESATPPSALCQTAWSAFLAMVPPGGRVGGPNLCPVVSLWSAILSVRVRPSPPPFHPHPSSHATHATHTT